MTALAPVLSTRALNRALLARQGLLEPWDEPLERVIERLIGLQSQDPNAAYVALWARLKRFEPADLSQLLLDRAVVRIALMRSTIFLVTAADACALRPVMQPVMDVALRSNSGKRTAGVDVDRLTELARAHLESEPRTFAQLGSHLAGELGDFPPSDLANVARTTLPLVQVTPRGVWGQSRAAFHTTLESWIGRPTADDSDPSDAIRRYLTAFGPATAADVTTWSGVKGTAAYLNRMRDGLDVFSDARGRTLFDVPDGLRPDPDTPVPPRILAPFDNIVLSHADRSRIVADEDRDKIITFNGQVHSSFLIDGFVHGAVVVRRSHGTATATATPFRPLGRTDQRALRTELARLLEFLAPDDHPVIEIS